MKASKYQFALDLHEAQSQICLMATQGDTNRQFVISLSDGGESYSVEGVRAVHLLIERPDKTTIVETNPRLSDEHDTVIYDFTSVTCYDEGLHDCQLIFYGDGGEDEVLWSPCFSLYVNKKKRDLTT